VSRSSFENLVLFGETEEGGCPDIVSVWLRCGVLIGLYDSVCWGRGDAVLLQVIERVTLISKLETWATSWVWRYTAHIVARRKACPRACVWRNEIKANQDVTPLWDPSSTVELAGPWSRHSVIDHNGHDNVGNRWRSSADFDVTARARVHTIVSCYQGTKDYPSVEPNH
jgi:hypothetical protein